MSWLVALRYVTLCGSNYNHDTPILESSTGTQAFNEYTIRGNKQEKQNPSFIITILYCNAVQYLNLELILKVLNIISWINYSENSPFYLSVVKWLPQVLMQAIHTRHKIISPYLVHTDFCYSFWLTIID